MMPFIFVTGSTNKVAEAERILRFKLEHRQIDLPEIQAVDVEEVITYKAKYAYSVLDKKPVMIEDTGLYIEAWNGLPGALVKWFIEKIGDTGICEMMHSFTNKNAWARTAVATYDGELKIFSGEVRGRIADTPIGNEGFGWDRLFIPAGSDKTFGEMLPEEKDRYSMRRIGLEQMAAFYSKIGE
jgi:non-canonical purine NTP pyrophosphatase (RdgB/HAM1 family)